MLISERLIRSSRRALSEVYTLKWIKYKKARKKTNALKKLLYTVAAGTVVTIANDEAMRTSEPLDIRLIRKERFIP